jgi:hypothetical protein
MRSAEHTEKPNELFLELMKVNDQLLKIDFKKMQSNDLDQIKDWIKIFNIYKDEFKLPFQLAQNIKEQSKLKRTVTADVFSFVFLKTTISVKAHKIKELQKKIAKNSNSIDLLKKTNQSIGAFLCKQANENNLKNFDHELINSLSSSEHYQIGGDEKIDKELMRLLNLNSRKLTIELDFQNKRQSIAFYRKKTSEINRETLEVISIAGTLLKEKNERLVNIVNFDTKHITGKPKLIWKKKSIYPWTINV